jgi:hypothetical protein
MVTKYKCLIRTKSSLLSTRDTETRMENCRKDGEKVRVHKGPGKGKSYI